MGERLAFLIGNQTFDEAASGLKPLRGPHNDVAAMAEILGDPERGSFAVRTFLDAPHHLILREIEATAIRMVGDDLLVIFYAGHGTWSSGQYCLATADTVASAVQATSIATRRLADIPRPCEGTIVVLLDCCDSGKAAEHLTRGDLGSAIHWFTEHARGSFVLTSSTGAQTSHEIEIAGVVHGRFTATVLEGLRSGRAARRGDGRVRFSELRAWVADNLKGQTPRHAVGRNAEGDPIIARVPATPPAVAAGSGAPERVADDAAPARVETGRATDGRAPGDVAPPERLATDRKGFADWQLLPASVVAGLPAGLAYAGSTNASINPFLIGLVGLLVFATTLPAATIAGWTGRQAALRLGALALALFVASAVTVSDRANDFPIVYLGFGLALGLTGWRLAGPRAAGPDGKPPRQLAGLVRAAAAAGAATFLLLLVATSMGARGVYHSASEPGAAAAAALAAMAVVFTLCLTAALRASKDRAATLRPAREG